MPWMCAVGRDGASDETELGFSYSRNCTDDYDSGVEVCDLLDSSYCSSPCVDSERPQDNTAVVSSCR